MVQRIHKMLTDIADRELKAAMGRIGAIDVTVKIAKVAPVVRVAKDVDPNEIPQLNPEERGLAAFLVNFGLKQAENARKVTASALGADPDTTQQVTDLELELLRSKSIKVQGLSATTRARVQFIIQRVQEEALSEFPRPSTTEIARRIRDATKDDLSMSLARAERIARTEASQNENAGIMAGYRQAGISQIEWVTVLDSRTRDEPGGPNHRAMDGERTDVGVAFVMPGGARLMHPGDPTGPVEEIVNCRCTTIPV